MVSGTLFKRLSQGAGKKGSKTMRQKIQVEGSVLLGSSHLPELFLPKGMEIKELSTVSLPPLDKDSSRTTNLFF